MADIVAPAEAVARLERLLGLSPGARVERAYLFEPLERGGTSFSLVFVTQTCPDGRLEMVALGGRAEVEGRRSWDFVLRARFPRETLSLVLEEFLERCGVEGASYGEVDLTAEDGSARGLSRLAELLAFAGEPEGASRAGER